jgi:3-deoxy-D-manno-octulosonate 8-phosphate phosphatase KdsC-like HAD superfamily phosphatase
MASELLLTDSERLEAEWTAAGASVDAARSRLGAADGPSLQPAYTDWQASRRRCTDAVHAWLGGAFTLRPVREPRLVLSLDVDGILEDDALGFSTTDVIGAAALSLLRRGGVAVILNTGRSLAEVRERAACFGLAGGVAGYGASIWDAVYSRAERLTPAEGLKELGRLREVLIERPSIVLDSAHTGCIRAAEVTAGRPRPLPAEECRLLIDRADAGGIACWVARDHTDFVDRRVDKADGLRALLESLGLGALPVAAIGDSRCDVPMLRSADRALLPRGSLPGFRAGARQRLFRSRRSGTAALWDAACQLVPDSESRAASVAEAHSLLFPGWFPELLRLAPIDGRRWLTLRTSLGSIRRRRVKEPASEVGYRWN